MKEMKELSLKEEYIPRSIQYIVVHCSATRVNIPFTEEQLLKCHLQRGFKQIGYHFYVTKDGMLHHTRPMSEVGAHALGFNLHSLASVMKADWTNWGNRRTPDSLAERDAPAGSGRTETALSRSENRRPLSVERQYPQSMSLFRQPEGIWGLVKSWEGKAWTQFRMKVIFNL